MKTVIIRYPFAWGGQIKDRGFWEAKIEGESNVWDYDSKENLKMVKYLLSNTNRRMIN